MFYGIFGVCVCVCVCVWLDGVVVMVEVVVNHVEVNPVHRTGFLLHRAHLLWGGEHGYEPWVPPPSTLSHPPLLPSALAPLGATHAKRKDCQENEI